MRKNIGKAPVTVSFAKEICIEHQILGIKTNS